MTQYHYQLHDLKRSPSETDMHDAKGESIGILRSEKSRVRTRGSVAKTIYIDDVGMRAAEASLSFKEGEVKREISYTTETEEHTFQLFYQVENPLDLHYLFLFQGYFYQLKEETDQLLIQKGDRVVAVCCPVPQRDRIAIDVAKEEDAHAPVWIALFHQLISEKRTSAPGVFL